MQTRTKIYTGITLAAITVAAFVASSIWTTRKFTNLERELNIAKQAAQSADKLAAAREIEAAAYKQKIEYLETNLTAIQTIAKKQDEQLENLNINSRDARSHVEHLRRTRPNAVTDTELCTKLAEIGYGC